MRHFLFLFLILALSPLLARAAEERAVVAELFPQFEGIRVGKIEIRGLLRSREPVVRWILGAREGQPFNAQAWQEGIERLYKTESIYEIHTQIEKTGAAGQEELRIRVSLIDKWTLFPYFDIQGGGGSVSFSAGLYDANLLGTFTYAYVGGGYLDREYSYEVGLSQKWFLQTTYSLGFDLSKRNRPVGFQNAAGELQRNFSWARSRQLLAVGKQNGERTYWEIQLEAFRDTFKSGDSRALSFLYPDMRQFRARPMVKLGKMAHSDYLEQGHELSLAGSYANPLHPDRDYHSFEAAWKQVFYLPETRNIAYFLQAGHMTSAPVAYQFRLGGFDSVRGFSMNRVFGLDFARLNLEYRSTLLVYQIPFWDLGRMVLQGCVFTDGGSAWNAAGVDAASGALTQKSIRALYSAGAGLRTIFLHFANATARIDLAKTLVPQEGYNVAFGIGQFF